MDEGLKRVDSGSRDTAGEQLVDRYPPASEPSRSDPGDVPGDVPPADLEVASYGIRVTVRGGGEAVEPANLDEVNAKVKTAFAELMPGTVSSVRSERLDR